MEREKRKRIERKGWRTGSAVDFLGLSPEEACFVEMKVALADRLKRRRIEEGLTQGVVAERLGSSQSRVAKMEAGDPSVSFDLLLRSLLALGATRRDVAKAIAG